MTNQLPIPATSEPFAAGREADVFLLDDGRVLRRYRTAADTAHEAEIMAYAASHGYPVPAVYAASGPDMVMERLHGPTMAEAALAGDLALEDGAVMLADLLRRLHELPPRGSGSRDTIVHLDLHPENVLITERGPVVIDWRNAGDGPGDLDTALSALIIAQVAIGSIEHPLGASIDAMLDRFLELAPGDPVRLLDDAAAYRRGQLTMSPDEIAMIGTAVARVRAGVR
ncbi:phosphotransferase [Paractinoplanes rhizophilus]|uniref:Phosphotransferase n=1 Tax=Paractinoplanes rhizophilus TaxID=1416877 RepID=A0ABW2HX58_9ACTN